MAICKIDSIMVALAAVSHAIHHTITKRGHHRVATITMLNKAPSQMKAKHRSNKLSARANLLVVEDEQDLQELLRYNLEREGFAVQCAARGETALETVRNDPPDLILLDLMLPGMDGLDLCRTLKADEQTQSIPIVMLTAKGEEADIVVGLEIGADDYLVKPFSPRVLTARLKAVLRRLPKNDHQYSQNAVSVGDLTIDPSKHEVRIGDTPVPVTHTEFLIAQLLAQRPGRVFTRAQIIDGIQQGPVAVTDRSIDVHVVSMRKKFGDAGQYIQTVRGVGYRMKEIE